MGQNAACGAWQNLTDALACFLYFAAWLTFFRFLHQPLSFFTVAQIRFCYAVIRLLNPWRYVTIRPDKQTSGRAKL